MTGNRMLSDRMQYFRRTIGRYEDIGLYINRQLLSEFLQGFDGWIDEVRALEGRDPLEREPEQVDGLAGPTVVLYPAGRQ